MVAQKSHKLQGRFDSETTQPIRGVDVLGTKWSWKPLYLGIGNSSILVTPRQFYSRLTEWLGVWLQPLQDWLKSSTCFHFNNKDLMAKKNTDTNNYSMSKRAMDPKSLSRIFEFYVSGAITEPENYIDDFNTIRHAGPDDVVKIYLNSGGGYLATAIQFMRVLSETQALVVVSVEGDCMSAATMIFLSADEIEVSPHSSFMFHDYSGGTYGKGGTMHLQIQYERKWSEKLMQEVYADFLSPVEIEALLNGKDIWMDVDEVIVRMQAKATAAQELLALEEATKPD